MKGILSAVVCVGLAGSVMGQVYQQNPKPPTDGRVGSNYSPAYAVNQVQMWYDFRPDVIEKELTAASKYFGLSMVRTFLHNINFDQDRENFLKNIETYLTICDKVGVKPILVFFDDCHRKEGIYLDKPTKPVKGYHNGRWAWSPQERDRDPDNLEKFKPYVQTIIKKYKDDPRVLCWEIFNEPGPGKKYSRALSVAGYGWAKELEPTQPVINCFKSKIGWGDTDVTDIVDAHIYH